MEKVIKEDKINTKIGEFKVVTVPTGSRELFQDGTERISGYNVEDRMFYLSSDLGMTFRSACAQSFIKAIEEDRIK